MAEEYGLRNGENLFDASTIVAGDIKGADSTIRLSSRQALWLKEGTYTFSTTQGSPLRYAISVQDVGVPPLNSYPSTYILNSGWQTASTYTFTLQSPGYAVVSFSKENNAGITISELSSFSYQLEKGSTATTYEPYIEPSINVDKEEWYSKPKALYENTTGIAGSSSGTQITLNDNINNYSKLEVTLGISKSECDTYILPIWESSKTVSVFFATMNYYFRFRVEASNNTLTFTEVSIVGWSAGTSKLFRVVGYK